LYATYAKKTGFLPFIPQPPSYSAVAVVLIVDAHALKVRIIVRVNTHSHRAALPLAGTPVSQGLELGTAMFHAGPDVCATPVRTPVLHCIALKAATIGNHATRMEVWRRTILYFSQDYIFRQKKRCVFISNEMYKKYGVHVYTTAPILYKRTTPVLPEIGKQTRFINGPVAESLISG
jgi:hypothetical protein